MGFTLIKLNSGSYGSNGTIPSANDGHSARGGYVNVGDDSKGGLC